MTHHVRGTIAAGKGLDAAKRLAASRSAARRTLGAAAHVAKALVASSSSSSGELLLSPHSNHSKFKLMAIVVPPFAMSGGDHDLATARGFMR